MRPLWAALILICAAAPAAARDPNFAQPIDCELGKTCFVLNLMDADSGDGAADYTCGPRSYDTHKGTDFALPSLAAMQKGVQVLAVAPGRVRGQRDGVDDILFGSPGASDVEGKECGNGVVIDHGGGWVTQYCHMAKGSVAVEVGQSVRMGQSLGHVGLSGKTQYPHLHISVRKDGLPVDPFDPNGAVQCGEPPAPKDQLWRTPIPYPSGGIVNIGFAPDIPSYDAVKSGAAAHHNLSSDISALVGWSFVHGPRKGDILRIELQGPAGMVIEKDILMTKAQVLAFRAIGKKAKQPWPLGLYTLTSWLIREGRILGTQTANIHIR